MERIICSKIYKCGHDFIFLNFSFQNILADFIFWTPAQMKLAAGGKCNSFQDFENHYFYLTF